MRYFCTYVKLICILLEDPANILNIYTCKCIMYWRWTLCMDAIKFQGCTVYSTFVIAMLYTSRDILYILQLLEYICYCHAIRFQGCAVYSTFVIAMLYNSRDALYIIHLLLSYYTIPGMHCIFYHCYCNNIPFHGCTVYSTSVIFMLYHSKILLCILPLLLSCCTIPEM